MDNNVLKFEENNNDKNTPTIRDMLRTYFTGIVTGMLIFALVSIIFDMTGFHPFSKYKAAEVVSDRAKTVEAYIDRYYWKSDVSDEEFAAGAAKGMVEALGDPYSVYMTPSELATTQIRTDGDYAGIGCAVGLEPNTNAKFVTGIEEGRPADKAGLKVEDEITEINGESVASLSLDDMVSLIRGEEGVEIELTVLRRNNNSTSGSSDSENSLETTEKSGNYYYELAKDKTREKITIKVTTERIVNQSISYKMLEDNIGYIKITNFDKESVEQFEKALSELEKKQMESLVIDVRNNGGGVLTSTISMLDDLLPAGKLITETRKGSKDKEYKSTDEDFFDKPIVVLINGNSASASEVFAGCLQDREAATLIGEKSFGKGIVQTIYTISKKRGDGIKLTTGEYLLPSGRSIHEIGLTPDVELEYTGESSDYGTDKDNQLQEAVKYLKK